MAEASSMAADFGSVGAAHWNGDRYRRGAGSISARGRFELGRLTAPSESSSVPRLAVVRSEYVVNDAVSSLHYFGRSEIFGIPSVRNA